MTRDNRPRSCKVKGCDRPVRALGLCQTHYKQMRLYGETKPIKAKRPPRPETVRFSGLSLTPLAAELLTQEAERLNIAPNALITDILEAWAKRQRPAPKRR